MCVCLCLCMCVSDCVQLCSVLMGKLEVETGNFPLLFLSLFTEEGSLTWTQRWPLCLVSIASLSWGVPCPYLLSAGNKGGRSAYLMFMWVLGNLNTGFQVHGEYFTQWPISLALKLKFLWTQPCRHRNFCSCNCSALLCISITIRTWYKIKQMKWVWFLTCFPSLF